MSLWHGEGEASTWLACRALRASAYASTGSALYNMRDITRLHSCRSCKWSSTRPCRRSLSNHPKLRLAGEEGSQAALPRHSAWPGQE